MKLSLPFVGLLLFHGTTGWSQSTVRLEDCYMLAKKQYPIVKQKALIEKSTAFSIENASKGYLPQINFGGQATYQSDVTQVPIKVPGIQIPTMSKDQYKVYGEINQSLLDWTAIDKQKELYKANAEVENQKIEVELYKLNERINQLYFGILLLDEQTKQVGFVKNDLENLLHKTNGAITYGASLKSNLQLINAEILKLDQRIVELQSSRKAFVEMLALFTGLQLDEKTTFERPFEQSIETTIKRPELALYDSQKKGFLIQNQIITAKNIPKLGLFIQGGYGRPALNMLNNDFDFYCIGGVRFSWGVGGLYTIKKERQLLTLTSMGLDIQKETFLFNTQLSLKQQSTEIEKLIELIQLDNEIIALRTAIKNTASKQVENGIITTSDFLKEVNAEDQSKQNLLLHRIQLLVAQYNHKNTSGY